MATAAILYFCTKRKPLLLIAIY